MTEYFNMKGRKLAEPLNACDMAIDIFFLDIQTPFSTIMFNSQDPARTIDAVNMAKASIYAWNFYANKLHEIGALP
jgi:hypothetical protein